MNIEMEKTAWSEKWAARAHCVNGQEIAEMLRLSGSSDLVNLTGGFPDPSTFPKGVLAELAASAINNNEGVALQYAPTEGLSGLRGFLLDRLRLKDDIAIGDESLLITSGGMECLELICRTFLDPDDIVITEGPTYLGALTAFAGYEARIHAVPLDQDGISVDKLESLLASGEQPKLLYLIPDHQNPSGRSLSEEKRVRIIALARKYGFLIIEDVAYRELSFDGSRSTSLLSLAPECVVQMGTFSKTFSPGFRLGWAAGPQEIITQLTQAKQNSDQCAGALGQIILEEYGRSGEFEKTISSAQTFYQRRAHLMGEALEAHMPEGVSWSIPEGGFFYWVTLPESIDTTALKSKALANGVAYVPGRPFYPDSLRSNDMRLSFSRVKEGQVEMGIERLAGIVISEMQGA